MPLPELRRRFYGREGLQDVVRRPGGVPLAVAAARRASSALAGFALQSPPARRVESSHLLCEMAEWDVAVLIDERRNLRLSSEGHVFLARIRRGVVVGLAFATAVEEALRVQPRHDRHVGRVCARLGGALVQAFHNRSNGTLAGLPKLLHDLGFEFVQGRWRGLATRLGPLSECHLRRIIASASALAARPAHQGRAQAQTGDRARALESATMMHSMKGDVPMRQQRTNQTRLDVVPDVNDGEVTVEQALAMRDDQ